MKMKSEWLENFRWNHEKIIIYGAGVVGRVVLKKFLDSGVDVSYVAVTKRENNPFLIMGIPVVCVEELREYRDGGIVVIATMEDKQQNIRENLVSLGFHNIYTMTDDLYFEWKEQNCENVCITSGSNLIKRYEEPFFKTLISIFEDYHVEEKAREKYISDAKKILQGQDLNICRLVVVLGTKCSLRCRDCNNLMPYFKPQTDLNQQVILDSLKKITGVVGTILKCELIGGEPFLSDNFMTVLKVVSENPVIKSVEVTTNGTIIPDEKQTELLKNHKVLVRISDYGTLVDKNNIVRHLEENGIRYQVLNLGSWTAPGGVEHRGKNVEELKRNYAECPSGYYCKTLYEGKIFACARAASLCALGFMKEREFVDVKKGLESDELREFLLKDYSIACDYCDVASETKIYVEPAVQK